MRKQPRQQGRGICVRVSEDAYDVLCATAARHGCTIRDAASQAILQGGKALFASPRDAEIVGYCCRLREAIDNGDTDAAASAAAELVLRGARNPRGFALDAADDWGMLAATAAKYAQFYAITHLRLAT